jgi:putative transposase
MVRRGASQRSVARDHGISLHTVQRWVARAEGQRLDRVDWGDRSSAPGRTARTAPALEDLILDLRRSLREDSTLGEYGAVAIHRKLDELAGSGLLGGPLPTIRTIGRILARRGALDARRRTRRPAPPAGWYLADVAARRVELDSFDVIIGLKTRRGPDIDVLTGVSLHGGLPAAWPGFGVTAGSTIDALTGHWRSHGLPAYAQFDNDTRFQGAHGFPGRVGRVMRFCLGLGVVPVFAPPRETGFQASIESFNGRWQTKVWQRFFFESLGDLRDQSDQYVGAVRAKLAVRIEAAPPRRPFPSPWDLVPASRVIYLRRTSESGAIRLEGRSIDVDRHWPYRLVRAEWDVRSGILRCYALRRHEPADQPLLVEAPFALPTRRL